MCSFIYIYTYISIYIYIYICVCLLGFHVISMKATQRGAYCRPCHADAPCRAVATYFCTWEACLPLRTLLRLAIGIRQYTAYIFIYMVLFVVAAPYFALNTAQVKIIQNWSKKYPYTNLRVALSPRTGKHHRLGAF